MRIRSLSDIEIYKQSLISAHDIYALCKNKKLLKEFSLIDQMKRASLSVSANIAEGYGRKTKQDFAHFLSISLGSCNELIAFLDFIELEFSIPVIDLKNKYDVLSKRIYAFRLYLLTHNP